MEASHSARVPHNTETWAHAIRISITKVGALFGRLEIWRDAIEIWFLEGKATYTCVDIA